MVEDTNNNGEDGIEGTIHQDNRGDLNEAKHLPKKISHGFTKNNKISMRLSRQANIILKSNQK